MHISRRKLVSPLLLWTVAGVAVYAVAALIADLPRVWSASGRLGLGGWAAVLGLSLLNYGLRFGRWHHYLARLGHTVPVGPHCAYYLAGFAFTMTPAKAGEAVRCLYLKRHGVDYADSLAAMLAERFADVAAMLLLAIAAVAAFPAAQAPVMAVGIVTLAVIGVLHIEPLQRKLLTRAADIRHPGLRQVVKAPIELLRPAAVLLTRWSLAMGILVGLTAWAAEGIGLHLVASALGIPASPGHSIGIYAISILVGALSFIPGGLGSTEASMTLLLVWSGADAASALAATLICRVATLWFAVLIGAVVSLTLQAIGRGVGDSRARTKRRERDRG